MEALLREIKEELGDEISAVIQKLQESKKLKELVKSETENKHTITYGAIIEEVDALALIKKEKSPSFGGFKLIKRYDVNKIVDIQTIDKKTGVTDENVIAMFPDEKEAVRLAFEKLS